MEPYNTNTGVHNRVQITIDLNELVWARGEFLKQEMSVNQAEYLAETLRRTLTWDTMYSMIDQTILEFFDCHEHPEIWDPHYGEIAGDEPAKSFEEAQKRFKRDFTMITIKNSAWELEVPIRKDRLQSVTKDDAEDQKNGII
tara:strand:+ start:1217 stop:1642 length:426 start_codon:yes stop_codon:yes gene_type:complete